MKRYRDCIVALKNAKEVASFMKSIKSAALSMEFKIIEDSTSLIGSNVDNLDLQIKFDKLPMSRVIVCAFSDDNPRIEVVNIVPAQASGISELDVSTYNMILDLFIEQILSPVCSTYGVKYESSNEHYSIKEYIPKSFDKLDLWLKGFPISCHPSDDKRWFDFIVALVKNGEDLSVSTFEEYIAETQNSWMRSDIERFSEKLVYGVKLLKYYLNGDC